MDGWSDIASCSEMTEQCTVEGISVVSIYTCQGWLSYGHFHRQQFLIDFADKINVKMTGYKIT